MDNLKHSPQAAKPVQKQPLKTLVFAVSVATLSACQSFTQIENPSAQVDLDRTYLSDQANAEALNYRTYFTDPKLVAVIDQALSDNRSLKSAVAAVSEVQARYDIAKVSNLPTLALSSQYSRTGDYGGDPQTITDVVQEVFPTPNQYSAQLALSAYEIDFWGRVKNLKDQALSLFLSTNFAKESAQVSIISQTAQTWVSYSYALAQVRLAEQTLDNQLNALDLNRKRLNAGIDSELSVVQAQTQVENARLSLDQALTQVKQTQNALELLVGGKVDPSLLPPAAIDRITRKRGSTPISSEVLLLRPDVRQSEFELLAAGANIGVARGAYYPSVTLFGSTGTATTQADELFTAPTLSWTLGSSVNLPLFDFGRRKANLKVAKAQATQTLYNYEQAILTALREVGDVVAFDDRIESRLNSQSRLVAAADRSLELSDLRFRAGLDSYLNVLDAQRFLFQSRQSALVLKQQALTNEIVMFQVLGGNDGVVDFRPERVERSFGPAGDPDRSAIKDFFGNLFS